MAGGNVRWCMLTLWHFNKQQVWRGSWLVMFHLLKMSSTACTIARVCNKMIMIIAACRKSSQTSRTCSVKPLIMIFIMMIMCESVHWNKGYNLQMREGVAWTKNDEIIGWFRITMFNFHCYLKGVRRRVSSGGWISSRLTDSSVELSYLLSTRHLSAGVLFYWIVWLIKLATLSVGSDRQRSKPWGSEHGVQTWNSNVNWLRWGCRGVKESWEDRDKRKLD